MLNYPVGTTHIYKHQSVLAKYEPARYQYILEANKNKTNEVKIN